jgi:hypothetical protein
MKRADGIFCDRCHLVIAPQAPDRLSYGKTDYHASCYLAYRKETNPRVQLDELRLVFLIIAALWVLASFSPAEANDQPGDVRGCIATYISQSGKYLYEPFLKVADKESPAEDGAAEVWGFRPWNLEPPDKEGKTHAVNVRADVFIPLHVFQQVGPRRVKCPDGMWGTE